MVFGHFEKDDVDGDVDLKIDDVVDDVDPKIDDVDVGIYRIRKADMPTAIFKSSLFGAFEVKNHVL